MYAYSPEAVFSITTNIKYVEHYCHTVICEEEFLRNYDNDTYVGTVSDGTNPPTYPKNARGVEANVFL